MHDDTQKLLGRALQVRERACALCRQKIREFADPETCVTAYTLDGQSETKTIGELYPVSFTIEDLQ